MGKISCEQLYDYLDCPLKFSIKHVAKLDLDNNINIAFSKTVHEVIYNFWYRILDNKPMSEVDIYNKWASTWATRSEFDINEHMIASKASHTNEIAKLGQRGATMIHNFYKDASKNIGIPLAINQDFEVPIGQHILSGKFELVREVIEQERRRIEITDYRTGQTSPDQFTLDNDLYLTVQVYAFRKLFEAHERDVFYYFLKDDKKIKVKRNLHDFARLSRMVDFIVTSIENRVYYPRQSFQCKQCMYKSICENWPVEKESLDII
jgi:CRISPR/Cas system-associated exonuclease Cas4 (RecB family)